MKKLYSIITLWLLLALTINAQEGVELLGTLNPRASQGYNDIWGYSSDGREYALLCTGSGTSIIEITDPANPVEISLISGPQSTWRDVKTHNTYAYVITEGTSGDKGLQIIDLSNLPNNASLVNTTDEFFDSAHNIFIDDGFAYVIGTNDGGGMHILDLSDPENPVRTAYYTESNYVHDVYVWNDTVVACAASTYDLVDVTDKSNPVKISSSASLPGTYAHSGWMTEDKRYFVAAEEFNSRDITVWDLKDRTNWNLVVDKFSLTEDSPVHNIFIKGDYAHISYYKEGYVVLDISEPENPLVVGQYDTYPSSSGTFAGAWGCYPYFPSGKIIVSDMSTGLYIFSFTPVENPAPFLMHTSVGSEIEGEVPVTLELEVLDDGAIEEIFVYYRTIVEDEVSDWVAISGSEGIEENIYEFTIPAQEHLTEVEYYFGVKDDGGKVVTSPSGGSGTPAGSNPPDEFYSFTIIDAGVPNILSLSPEFSDTTIAKGQSINFSVSAIDTSSLDLSYSWFVNNEKRSSDTTFTYGTTFIFSSRTDTVSLVISNGYEEVKRQWIITVDLTLDAEDELQLTYKLNQNYPNPFNPSTIISYTIPVASSVELKIFNSLGELVITLVNKYQNSGKYEATFNAETLSSGFYIARIIAGNFSENIKMLLIK